MREVIRRRGLSASEVAGALTWAELPGATLEAVPAERAEHVIALLEATLTASERT